MQTVKLGDEEYALAEVPRNWVPEEPEHRLASLLGGLKKELCGALSDTQALDIEAIDPDKYVETNAGLYVPQTMCGVNMFAGSMTGDMIVQCFANRSQVPNAGWGGHNGLNDVHVDPEHAEELASIFNLFAEKYGYKDKITSYACACFIALPSTENGSIEPGNTGGPFAVIRAQTKWGSNWESFDRFCQSNPEFSDCSSAGLRQGSSDRKSCYVAGAWYFFVHTKQIEYALSGDGEQIARHHLGAGYPEKYFQKNVMFDSNQYFYGYIHGAAPGEFGFDKNHPNYVGQTVKFNEIITGLGISVMYNGLTAAPGLIQPVNPETGVRGSKEWACGGRYEWKIGSPPESVIRPRITSVRIPVRDKAGKPSSMTIQVHRGLAQKFTAVFTEIYRNTNFKVVVVGGYQYRVVPGKTTLSNHSFGTAVDINPSFNPWPKTGRHNLRSEEARRGDSDLCVRSVYHPVVQIFAKYGFVWGARYNVGPDYMHFEWIGPS